jgi:hypothetical protein
MRPSSVTKLVSIAPRSSRFQYNREGADYRDGCEITNHSCGQACANEPIFDGSAEADLLLDAVAAFAYKVVTGILFAARGGFVATCRFGPSVLSCHDCQLGDLELRRIRAARELLDRVPIAIRVAKSIAAKSLSARSSLSVRLMRSKTSCQSTVEMRRMLVIALPTVMFWAPCRE